MNGMQLLPASEEDGTSKDFLFFEAKNRELCSALTTWHQPYRGMQATSHSWLVQTVKEGRIGGGGEKPT